MEQTLQVILIAAGALVVVIMLFAAAACAARRKNRGEIPITWPLAATWLPFTFDPKQASMAELEKATHNFSPDLIIGRGSFGMVYKAHLPHAGLSTVAVKKLSPDAFHGFCEFRAETAALSKLRHPNIVTILGFCDTGSNRVLVYENIKASKVLLDNDFQPHIADFGLARIFDDSLSYVSTQVAGTMGYMPPEYIQGATMATAMGDVYSFGILMLQISTGIIPDPFEESNWMGGNGGMFVDWVRGKWAQNLHIRPGPFEESNGMGVRFVERAREKWAQNLHMKILDANIYRARLEESGVVEFLRIALLCASYSSTDRPPMREVVELLNRIPT